MVDRSAYGFPWLLNVLIETHREAKRTCLLWARIRVILAVSIGLLIGASWYSAANAAPVPAYPGCKFAWDYTWPTPGTPKGFGVRVGTVGVLLATPADRVVDCAKLNLATGTQTIGIQARMEDGRVSEWASLEINYGASLPVVPKPTGIKLLMEWELVP